MYRQNLDEKLRHKPLMPLMANIIILFEDKLSFKKYTFLLSPFQHVFKV